MKEALFLTTTLVLITFLAIIVCLSGCDSPPMPKYIYSVEDFIPDSNKTKMAEWIKETMAASSFRLKTSDYEDPEDVVEQLEETGEKLFSVKTEGLKILFWENENFYRYEFFPKDKLSKEQLVEFERLKK